jgi:hypothetical protein
VEDWAAVSVCKAAPPEKHAFLTLGVTGVHDGVMPLASTERAILTDVSNLLLHGGGEVSGAVFTVVAMPVVVVEHVAARTQRVVYLLELRVLIGFG